MQAFHNSSNCSIQNLSDLKTYLPGEVEPEINGKSPNKLKSYRNQRCVFSARTLFRPFYISYPCIIDRILFSPQISSSCSWMLNAPLELVRVIMFFYVHSVVSNKCIYLPNILHNLIWQNYVGTAQMFKWDSVQIWTDNINSEFCIHIVFCCLLWLGVG